jgi:3-oxoacyl-[acyl-carrier protein] reductase
MLKGKNAIITGARRGIGRATVEVFAENGANIWACARNKDNTFEADMAGLAKKYNVSIWPIYFDLTDEDQMKSAIQEIRKTAVHIDALVNVAGVADQSTSFPMTSMEKMKHTFEVNFFSLSKLLQYISRIMIKQNSGSIVNIASVAGIDGTPAQYEYASSKAAVIGGTKELARELGKYNIRVNAVAPGMINTDMGAQIGEELKKATLQNVIMNRLGKPEEIANVIAFLASDKASFMTGQIIRVDGGM